MTVSLSQNGTYYESLVSTFTTEATEYIPKLSALASFGPSLERKEVGIWEWAIMRTWAYSWT